ncbi:ATP-binding cassette domain-containing protein [Rothia sp. ARF10]|nr:ATP-binding cassette domain-containing protein [Rothia sp. ARF10]
MAETLVVPAPGDTVAPRVVAERLTYGYRRGLTVLDGVDLALRPGEVVALTGPSGRGKSTLLYLLAGLLRPWSGAVLLDGVDLGALADPERSLLRARTCGFVFQDVVLDPRRRILDSVLEPARYAGHPPKRWAPRALELLESMGVALQADARPGEVSGGQAQRIGVCRALLMGPRVVFADEPTGNLDHASAEAVLDALDGAARAGAVVVIATHDDRVVERCSSRVVLT